MKTFQLTQEEMDILLEVVSGNPLVGIFPSRSVSDLFVLELSKEQQEKIVDLLDQVLIQKGLRDDDEPNEYGLAIERLIDIFNPYK